jgi:bile acid:Na+ symporter, BASS family
MAEALRTLSTLATLTFVVTSMLLVGLGLTLFEITQPLRNIRLVLLALAANFLVVPVVAVVLPRLISLGADDEIGLVLLGVAAGAPFLPKLAQLAKADVSVAVALMALLIVATVLYLPVTLPLLLPGIRVDTGSIVLSLLLTILMPLGLGLVVRSRWTRNAQILMRPLTVVSNISLLVLLALLLGLNIDKVLRMFGSGSILAIVVLTVVAAATGFLLGGPNRDTRHVLALGTSQRNIAACFIIANANFGDRPHVLVLLAAASVIGMLLIVPLAVLFARRPTGVMSAAGDRPLK